MSAITQAIKKEIELISITMCLSTPITSQNYKKIELMYFTMCLLLYYDIYCLNELYSLFTYPLSPEEALFKIVSSFLLKMLVEIRITNNIFFIIFFKHEEF